MQKVHGPPVETTFKSGRGYLAHPMLGPLVVSLSLLLVLYALIYFNSFGGP